MEWGISLELVVIYQSTFAATHLILTEKESAFIEEKL